MISDEVLTRIANPPTPKYRDLNVVSNSLELETYMRFGQKWMAKMAQELLQARQRIRELEDMQRWEQKYIIDGISNANEAVGVVSIALLRYWTNRMRNSLVKSLLSQKEITLLNNKWIPVSERLPENSGRVFIHMGNKYEVIASLVKGKFINDAGSECSNVTHWRPLPEPPEEK